MDDPGSDFNLPDLYAAMDAKRQALGLSWQQAVREINAPFGRVPSRPISASTIISTRTKEVGEGDGILQMLRWLQRTPESFIRGLHASGDEALPTIRPNRILRFDTRKLHAALNARRAEHGQTWRQIATEIGVTTSTLTHLAQGGRTGFPHVVRLSRWLGRPVADFTRACDR
jgi:hypothetical protein